MPNKDGIFIIAFAVVFIAIFVWWLLEKRKAYNFSSMHNEIDSATVSSKILAKREAKIKKETIQEIAKEEILEKETERKVDKNKENIKKDKVEVKVLMRKITANLEFLEKIKSLYEEHFMPVVDKYANKKYDTYHKAVSKLNEAYSTLENGLKNLEVEVDQAYPIVKSKIEEIQVDVEELKHSGALGLEKFIDSTLKEVDKFKKYFKIE